MVTSLENPKHAAPTAQGEDGSKLSSLEVSPGALRALLGNFQSIQNQFHYANSWADVHPGDVLLDSHGTLEGIVGIKALPVDRIGQMQYEVELVRGNGKGEVVTTTEIRNNSDFCEGRELSIIGRMTAQQKGQDYRRAIHDQISNYTIEQASNLRASSIELIVNGLISKSLAFTDSLVERLGDEQTRKLAFENLRDYQSLLKYFYHSLKKLDLKSHQAMAILGALQEENSPQHELSLIVETRDPKRILKLCDTIGRALNEQSEASALTTDVLSSTTAQISKIWDALSSLRTSAARDVALQGAPSQVSTRLYRGQAPLLLIDMISDLVTNDHTLPADDLVKKRGLVCNTYSSSEIQEALDRGAHLLVSHNIDHPDKIAGFMIYYPPDADLPNSLRPLKKIHPLLSTAVVDLVYVASDAPRSTFNSLFWGHRMALQATSDTMVHVGELAVNNLASFTALINRSAAPDSSYNLTKSNWQKMTVPIDVGLYTTDDNPFAAMMLTKQKVNAEVVSTRLSGDITPGALQKKVQELKAPIHIHLPDVPLLFSKSEFQHFSDTVAAGLKNFSGLLTGPAKQAIQASDGTFNVVTASDVARVFNRIREENSTALSVGIFGYNQNDSEYARFDEVNRGEESLIRASYPKAIPETAPLIIENRSITNRMKIPAMGFGNDSIISAEERAVAELSLTFTTKTTTHPNGLENVLILPLNQYQENPSYQLWLETSKFTRQFHLILIGDKPADANLTTELVHAKGRHRMTVSYAQNGDQLAQLIDTLIKSNQQNS